MAQGGQGPAATSLTRRWGMTEPIRVLIADDETLIRAGFRALIEAEPGMIVVGEAADGAAAVDLAQQTHPDVVLMDIRTPGADGLDATRQIAGAPGLAHVHVLILTTFDHDEYVIEALGAGASGFVIKEHRSRPTAARHPGGSRRRSTAVARPDPPADCPACRADPKPAARLLRPTAMCDGCPGGAGGWRLPATASRRRRRRLLAG